MTSALLDEPATTATTTHTDHGQRLQSRMAAARLSFTWLGVRKTLTAAQKSQAADSFGAEGKFLSADKKLLDTRHPAFKAVTAIRGRTVAYWKSVSLPFPEAGIRLIRHETVREFDEQLAEFRVELDAAVAELDRHYHELRSAARERLGDLFDITDYPGSMLGLFAIEHDFPSVEPPDYLRQLSPELYEQECHRVQARFEEAVQLAEAAFTEELAKLVQHLAERVQGEVDGKPKVFRDSAITNLTDFFERFRRLNIRSNAQLDELVATAQQVMQGVEPGPLRNSQALRTQIATEMASVQAGLDQLLVDRPRRNIQRRSRSGSSACS